MIHKKITETVQINYYTKVEVECLEVFKRKNKINIKTKRAK